MPRTPEQKPTYLQDVIAPKETEKTPEGFDLDREFGKGTAEKLEEILRKDALRAYNRVSYNRVDYFKISVLTHFYIIFDTHFLTEEQKHKVAEAIARKTKATAQNRRKSERWRRPLEYAVLSGKHTWNTEQEAAEVETILKNDIRVFLVNENFYAAAVSAAYYWALFQKRVWTEKQQGCMEQALRHTTREYFKENDWRHADESVACYRLLRAHDIKFIPGKGIEIIDTSPQPYQQKPIPPMPEERKF